jgi:hypothetical protein
LHLYEQVRQALIEKFGEKIPGQQAIVRHLNSSVILDIMLIQQWILVILNDQLNNIPSNFKKLNELKREILLGLEEFHNVTLIHGETQDIIRQVRERSGINESYNNLLKKINYIDKLIDAEEADRRAKRDLILKFAALGATVAFGLVASSRTIDIIIEWKDKIPNEPNGWMIYLSTFVGFIQMHSIEATIALYLW